MELNEEEVLELLRLVRECDLEVLDITIPDFELHASTVATSAGAGDVVLGVPARTETGRTNIVRTGAEEDARQEPAKEAESAKPIIVDETLHAVTAPLLGIFFRAPEPGAEPFTKVGAEVDEDTVIGLMEVMKTYSSVTAGVRGTVTEIVAEDGALIEYGQTLLLVEPAV